MINFQLVKRVFSYVAEHCAVSTDNENVYNDSSSESCTFNEIGEVRTALEKMLLDRKKYIVWNPSKVSSTGINNGESYDALLDAEKISGCAISSVIETDNIKAFIDAVEAETDVCLMFQRVELV